MENNIFAWLIHDTCCVHTHRHLHAHIKNETARRKSTAHTRREDIHTFHSTWIAHTSWTKNSVWHTARIYIIVDNTSLLSSFSFRFFFYWNLAKGIVKNMSLPKNLQDCYFFYYSACRKVSITFFSSNICWQLWAFSFRRFIDLKKKKNFFLVLKIFVSVYLQNEMGMKRRYCEEEEE